jgi:RNA polymerase sigma-70 factor (ECF subfamily)
MLQAVWSDVVSELAHLAAAMGVAGDRIEDVLQEVFVAGWQRGPACADRQQLKWWLIRVMTNRCNLVHRRRARWRRMWQKVTRLSSALRMNESLQGGAFVREEREMVAEALEDLPPRQRAVLVLRYFEDYDSKQIGRILQMPDSTVRSHLRKARKALADKLTRAGYEYNE